MNSEDLDESESLFDDFFSDEESLGAEPSNQPDETEEWEKGKAEKLISINVASSIVVGKPSKDPGNKRNLSNYFILFEIGRSEKHQIFFFRARFDFNLSIIKK